MKTNIKITIRDLAKQYMGICQSDRNADSVKLWRDHNSLIKTRPPVIVSWDFAFPAYDEIVAAFVDQLIAVDQPFRTLELWLRLKLWAWETIHDDSVYSPWYSMRAKMLPLPENNWGIKRNVVRDEHSHGWRNMSVVKIIEDLAQLQVTEHKVIDDNTPEIQMIRDLIGDILPVHVDKSTVYPIWGGTDLSETAGALFGLEELLYLLYTNPELVHKLMAFMRDAVLANLEQGEAAGDWSTAGPWGSVENQNYNMPQHTNELPEPKANSHGAKLKDLWFFTHAQEFEGVSPAQHEEFLLQYQMSIMEKFGLVNYGCCETLDNKIDILRKISNLRRILMGPLANLKNGCDQIGRDYVVSWRPTPAVVSSGFDSDAIRESIKQGFEDSGNCNIEIMLKEVMTVQNDLSRLAKWAEIARQEAENA